MAISGVMTVREESASPPPVRWHILLTCGAGLLLLIWTFPAFRSFFLGEDFEAWGLYRFFEGDLRLILVSPYGGIWFRPVSVVLLLPWYPLLPRDPVFFHIRNFLFSVINIFLLSLILGRLRVSRKAHVLSILFFTLSKVHFTLIGYIALYYALSGLTLLLSTFFFFLRFMESRRRLDYVLGLLCFSLLVHVRDSHLVGLGVLAVLGFAYGLPAWRGPGAPRRWILDLVPLVILAGIYLVLRFMIVGLPPSHHPTYTPRLSLRETAVKALLLLSAGANVSLTDAGTVGAPGLVRRPALRLSPGATPIALGDALLALAWVLCLVLLVRRKVWRELLFPLSWVVLYFIPPALILNRQIYYMQESLAGLAVFLAVGLNGAGPYLQRAWRGLLVVMAANGLVSNYTSSYHWQFAARQVWRAYQAVRAGYSGPPLRSVTFITRSTSFWRWALLTGPVLPYVLRQDDLLVRVMNYQRARRLLWSRQDGPDSLNLYIDVDNGFVPYDPHKPSKPLVLRSLMPAQVKAGERFNIQPDGQSALAVVAENATPGTVIVMGGQTLLTTYGHSAWLTALVPSEFLDRPGTYPVYLTDGLRESNRLDFIVMAKGPVPILLRLHPPRTRAGQGFNLQPGGQSALAVQAADATSDTVIVWGTRTLVTTYGGPTLLTALVPVELYARPGRYLVYLRNRFGESNRLEFVVEP